MGWHGQVENRRVSLGWLVPFVRRTGASQGLSAKISDFLRKRPNSSMPFSESSCGEHLRAHGIPWYSHYGVDKTSRGTLKAAAEHQIINPRAENIDAIRTPNVHPHPIQSELWTPRDDPLLGQSADIIFVQLLFLAFFVDETSQLRLFPWSWPLTGTGNRDMASAEAMAGDNPTRPGLVSSC